jgi:hypothetical protein
MVIVTLDAVRGMRAALLVALLLLLAAPAASAQMMANLDLQVKAPTEAVGAEGAQVVFKLTRICPNQVALMPDEVVRLDVQGPPGSVIDGPESVILPGHPCLGQSMDEATGEYLVKLPADAAPDGAFTYHIDAQPSSGGNPLTGMTAGTEARFTLTSPPAPPSPPLETFASNVTDSDLQAAAQQAEEIAQDPGVMDVPGPSWLVAILGIGLAALRRR